MKFSLTPEKLTFYTFLSVSFWKWPRLCHVRLKSVVVPSILFPTHLADETPIEELFWMCAMEPLFWGIYLTEKFQRYCFRGGEGQHEEVCHSSIIRGHLQDWLWDVPLLSKRTLVKRNKVTFMTCSVATKHYQSPMFMFYFSLVPGFPFLVFWALLPCKYPVPLALHKHCCNGIVSDHQSWSHSFWLPAGEVSLVVNAMEGGRLTFTASRVGTNSNYAKELQ